MCTQSCDLVCTGCFRTSDFRMNLRIIINIVHVYIHFHIVLATCSGSTEAVTPNGTSTTDTAVTTAVTSSETPTAILVVPTVTDATAAVIVFCETDTMVVVLHPFAGSVTANV